MKEEQIVGHNTLQEPAQGAAAPTATPPAVQEKEEGQVSQMYKKLIERGLSEVIGELEAYDFSDTIAYFNESKIKFHNGQDWQEPNVELVKIMACKAYLGSYITAILQDGLPCAIEAHEVGEGEIGFTVGEAIADIPYCISLALSEFDFAGRIEELKKYNRTFESDETTEEQLRIRAKEIIEALLSGENLHLAGMFAVENMLENQNQIQGGFIAQRTIGGVELGFVYAGASGDDVPKEPEQEIEDNSPTSLEDATVYELEWQSKVGHAILFPSNEMKESVFDTKLGAFLDQLKSFADWKEGREMCQVEVTEDDVEEFIRCNEHHIHQSMPDINRYDMDPIELQDDAVRLLYFCERLAFWREVRAKLNP